MRSITFLFTGDFAPVRRYEKLVLKKGRDIFGDLQEDIFDADVSFVNLESPLCLSDKAIKKSGPNLKAHPNCIEAIKGAGFDVVGLANNHIMDYGKEGLDETFEACQQFKLDYSGAGENLKESQKPLILERGGKKIAIIAVAEHEFSIAEVGKPGVAPLDPIDNTIQIEKARREADFVFITIHGGNEYFPYPRPGLKKLCRYFIDRGVDAVICHHPHIPGAYEFYQSKPIVYSLGNILFDSKKPIKDWNNGYAFRLVYSMEKKTLVSYEFIPYYQSVENMGIRKLHSVEKNKFLKRLDFFNKILLDEASYSFEWKNFCQRKESNEILRQYSPVLFKGIGRLTKVISPKRFFLTKTTIRSKLNMIRCESHLELLQTILEEEHNKK
ncbi:CapA family protein [Nitrosococcus wardiae]|uniref:CapA family protein n=1 Tax=Nitrosococcus wardiae TaxID=1814290 RepID=A0A4P7BZ01_9GAMM|nr:CapA family protein [Nitrosococcus wardiae]QBQ54414.1 CapA family protein [Nitrosococcus wardiae]